MEVHALLQSIETGLPVHEKKALQQKLQNHINYLISNNFERLVQLLYTVDVDERKLKLLLQQHQHADAASIIAELIIERQLQKAYTRQHLKTKPAMDEEERW